MDNATKVLVTGGAGFLGARLVRALVEAGHSVRILDDFSTGERARLVGLDVEVIEGDVRSATMVQHAITGAEVVFHLAGAPAPPHGPAAGALHAEDVNVGGTLQLLQAALNAGRPRVVIASTGAVYGRTEAYVLHEEIAPRPTTADGVQRLAVESYARLHRTEGLEVIALRLFRCYGPGERWEGERLPLVPALCRAALLGLTPRITGDGRQIRDLLYVEDAVAALMGAGRGVPVRTRGDGGWLYNVASGEPVSLLAAWALIAAHAGVPAGRVEHVPELPHEPPHIRVSIARARRDLGYRPLTPLREGLRRTVVHYRRALAATGRSWFMPRDASPATDLTPAPAAAPVTSPVTASPTTPPPAPVTAFPPPTPPPAPVTAFPPTTPPAAPVTAFRPTAAAAPMRAFSPLPPPAPRPQVKAPLLVVEHEPASGAPSPLESEFELEEVEHDAELVDDDDILLEEVNAPAVGM